MLKILSKATRKTLTRFPSQPFAIVSQLKPEITV